MYISRDPSFLSLSLSLFNRQIYLTFIIIIFSRLTSIRTFHTTPNVYIYIYICIYVCICVCYLGYLENAAGEPCRFQLRYGEPALPDTDNHLFEMRYENNSTNHTHTHTNTERENERHFSSTLGLFIYLFIYVKSGHIIYSIYTYMLI